MRKRNHYVPQFYLSYFLSDHEKELLWVYDKVSLGSRQQTPLNTAVEGHLYTITHPDGTKDDFIEKEVFTPHEGIAKPILDRWQMPGHRITAQEIDDISMFLALLHARVPRNLALQDEITTATVVEALKELAEDDARFTKNYESYKAKSGDTDILSPEECRQFLRDPERHCKIIPPDLLSLAFNLWATDMTRDVLHKLNWSLCDAPRGSRFITCDSPLVSFVETRPGFARFGCSFLSPNLEISFAVSPDVCLYLQSQKRQKRWRCGLEAVEEFNRRAICMSERFVFASFRSRRIERLVREFAFTASTPKLNRKDFHKEYARYRQEGEFDLFDITDS